MTDGPDEGKRKRGFLTKDDREYLRGEKENPPEGSAQRQKHLKIRNRLENAIHDFQIIEKELPDKDIEQVFEPIYKWGRERRRFNEEGRYAESPESNELIQSFISLFNFFGHSIALGRMRELNGLRNAIVEEGFERGLRKNALRNINKFVDYDANLKIEISDQMNQQDHQIAIDREISEKPDEAAKEIFDLYHQRRISASFAQKLWDDYVDQ